MPDDDRPADSVRRPAGAADGGPDRARHRLGDDTKARIADLASGWSTEPAPAAPEPRGDDTRARIAELAAGWSTDPSDAPPPPPARSAASAAAASPAPPASPDAGDPPRRKPKTLPPPPPGSAARKELEQQRGESAPIATARTKSGSTAKPPSLVKSGPTETGTVDVSGVIGGMTPAPMRVPAARSGPTKTTPPPPPRPGAATGSVPAIRPGGSTGVPVARPGVSTGSVPAIKPGTSTGSVPAIKPGTSTGSVPAIRPGVSTGGVPAIRPGASTGSVPAIKPGTSTGSVPAIPPRASITASLPLRADPTGEDPARAATALAPARPPRAIAPARTPSDAETIEEIDPTEVDPDAMHLTVPVGEFDHGATSLDRDKLRIAHEQATIKRDAASALLAMPEAPLTVVQAPPVEMLLTESAAQITRDDATSIDPQTVRFERGDPTEGSDNTAIQGPNALAASPAGTLRAHAALRRKRGIYGDVRYVATVLFGVRRARRELGTLELQQAQRQKERARYLTTLGRTAVIAEGYDHPALGKAREQLAEVEDERARHAAQVTAADSELLRVRTDRDFKVKQHAHDMAALEAELAECAKKLEPLEKEAAAATRRAGELHEALRRIDAQIAATEASKVAVKGPRPDLAAIQAELATLKADRLAVQRDEPVIAAQLDGLNPRLAALEARRTEARKKKQQLETAEQEDQRRAEELLAAIGAKRKVVDRAASDAETLRDKILLDLGERIYVDRPANMTAQLAPIDAIDVELGTTDRRIMELREILSSIDKAKLARGIAVIILVLAGLGSLAAWMIYLFA